MAQDKGTGSRTAGMGRVLAGGLAVLLAIILFSALRSQRVYHSYEVQTQISQGGDTSVYYVVLPYGLARYSSNGAALYDREGGQIWNQTYNMDEPIACAGDAYFAVGGRSANTVYVFDEVGQCGRITTDAPLQDLKISDQGVVAALLADKDSNYIDLFDRTGTRLASIKAGMTATGYPQAMDIAPDGKRLAAAYLKVDEGKIQTKVVFYSFEDPDEEHEIYSEVFDGLCPKAAYLNDTQAAFFFENGLRMFESGAQTQMTAQVDFEEEIRSVFTSAQKAGVIFRDPDAPEKFRVQMYDSRGRLSSDFSFELEYHKVSCKGEILIVYNDTQAQSFSPGGHKRMDIVFDETVTSIMPSWEQGRYWVAGESSLSEIRVK